MDIGNLCRTARRYITVGAALASTLLNLGTPALAADPPTTTPIKHVIVIIGENRSFDHVFGSSSVLSKTSLLAWQVARRSWCGQQSLDVGTKPA